MSRRIFQNGDILTAQDVNQIAYPNLSGLDAIGSGDNLPDEDLSDAPDQIKNRFYNFYDRLKVSHNTGLTFGYLGGSVLLSSGVVVTLSSGTINIPDNSNRFIYVNSSGAVEQGTLLPNECFPMARVATAGGTVSGSITDLRDKLVDRVQPASIPVTATFQSGMGMEYWGSTLPVGWLWQDGSTYPIATYPALAAALGPAFDAGGGNFRVPDRRGRVGVGAGAGAGLTTRTVGETFGAENHTLTVTETPSHVHGITETPHTHPIVDNGHNHGVNDLGHKHPIYANTTDGGSNQREQTDGFLSKNGVAITGEDTGGKGYINQNLSGADLVASSGTGISIQTNKANLAITAVSTGITTNPQGGGAAHNNCQPSISCNFIIKT
ncbi:hypothetical protein CLI64_11190 [Nostoc sp. CENA543]|uniref:tail fiber protein n=1 Tax=Nostoc sp. CENA543 TaxID=1869241 RepID=UPI000CA10340|nr:tail fiber protein [Nostoc sp. CENA543]AUT00919.1 hypothetical protein CLI64_11190 [Nostoc sp. CENA543]